jgi:AraC-like DNA-binding protein
VGSIANQMYLVNSCSYFLFMTSVFCSGPLNLLHYYSLVSPSGPFPFRVKLHLLPAAVAFIGEIIFHMQPAGVKIESLKAIFTSPSESPLVSIILPGGLHVTSYLLYLLKVELALWNSREIRRGLVIIAMTDTFAILSAVLLLTGVFTNNMTLFISGGVVISLIQMVIFLTSSRYSEFFRLFERELRKKRYERSILEGLDTEAIGNRLSELMSIDRLYRDYELGIEHVADKLSISTHQLSRFLNEKMNMEFRNYINSFRVDEAKKLLSTDPEHSIMSICFHVGFSSKSAFNSAFKKFTGMTPTDFRTKNLSREP